MPQIELIGSLAAVLTTTAFIPQVWQVWKTKHTKDISLAMYSLFTGGVAMWLVYGLLLNAWPIIIANAVTLLLAGSVLLLKLKFG
ncbi:MAG: SemiSWEET transporter [Sideroxydans sp.]|nr:SemiSWEET transporter [Sideroxydans sp.]